MKNSFKNRILAMLLSALLLIGMLPVYSIRVDSVEIEVGSVAFDRGVESAVDGYYIVDVPIKITRNTGLVSIKLRVNYDSELKLAGWTEGTVFPYIEGEEGVSGVDGLPSSDMISVHNITSNDAADLAKNPFTVYYVRPYDENNTSTGTLITLQFKVPADVDAGDYAVSATVVEVFSQEGDVGADVETEIPTDITENCTSEAGTITVEGDIDPDDTIEEDTSVYEIYVVTPEDILEEATGKDANLSIVEDGDKTYLRFDPIAANNASAGINWTMSDPLDASEYAFVKIGYTTNVKSVYNNAIAVQLSKDNTFNWQAKYFEVANYSYWTEKTEITTADVIFNMTGKAAASGATELQYFRILPFNGQTAEALSGELYFDIEYVAFFATAEEANAFDYDEYLENLPGGDTPEDVLYGDVNADGTVDRKDLTRLAQYFARWTVEIDEAAADANGDGTVDRKDLTRLAQYFARWSVELG